MAQFIELFGDISIATAFVYIAAFIWVLSIIKKAYTKVEIYFKVKSEKQNTIYNMATDIGEIKDDLKDIKPRLERVEKVQDAMIKDRDEQTKNRLRRDLLNDIRLYCDEKKNPLKAWTDLEKEAFENQFKDYEKLGGNGLLHEKAGELNALSVIDHTDRAAVLELTKSRV